MYNLFLDDERQSKCLGDVRTWETVRNLQEFISKIQEMGMPGFISFDHDLDGQQYKITMDEMLGDIIYSDPLWKDKTGYHCALYLIEYCRNKGLPIPEFQVHSMNPTGRRNIIQLLRDAKEKEHLWIC